MGADIEIYYEKKVNEKWEHVEVPHTNWKWGDPLGDRSYSRFGFLADVRNYSVVEPISYPRGIPNDASPIAKSLNEYGDNYSHSWLGIDELLSINPNEKIEDRRTTGPSPGGGISMGLTAPPGEGKWVTYEEFLGKSFFSRLKELKEAGVQRIVFAFSC